MSRAAPVPYAVGFLSADGRWRWDGFQWQPAQIGEKTHDELVKSAAYAAFASAGMFFLNQIVLFIVFTALLSNPSNNYLRPAFQTIDGLTLAVAWSLLFVVALGLFRLQRPSRAPSKVGLAFAGLGITLAVLDLLTIAVTADSGAYLFFPQEAHVAGLLVAPWLIVVNASLLRRMILSKPLAIIGMALGAAVAIDSISRLFNLEHLGSVGYLAVILGFILWTIWLGVALLRPLPVTAVPANVEAPATPVHHTPPPPLSPDGHWWWDGRSWQAVGRRAGGSAGSCISAVSSSLDGGNQYPGPTPPIRIVDRRDDHPAPLPGDAGRVKARRNSSQPIACPSGARGGLVICRIRVRWG